MFCKVRLDGAVEGAQEEEMSNVVRVFLFLKEIIYTDMNLDNCQ